MLWKRTIVMLAACAALILTAIGVAAMPERGRGPSLKLAPVDKTALTRIDIGGPKGAFSVIKRGEGWVLQPGDFPVDDAVAKRAVEMLAGLRFGAMVADRSAAFAKYEVNDENLMIAPFDAKGQMWRLLVGKAASDQRGSYVRVKGDDRVFVALARLRDVFDRDASYWRDKSIVKFDKDKAVALTLAGNGETLKFKKAESGDWSFDPPPAGLPADYRLDQDKVKRIVSTLAALTATEFDDGPATVDRGLEPPKYTVTATLADGAKVAVRLGAEKDAKDKPVYVQREGAPQVCLTQAFNANNLRKTVDELRDLRVVTFDPEKAKKYTCVEGARRIVVEKTGEDTWQITESTEPKPADYVIDPSKVMFVIRAAANLQGVSLVGKTAPAEAKLNAPTATVTIVTGDGAEKRILVGAEKDKDKQYVAGDGFVYLAQKSMIGRVVKKLENFKVMPNPNQAKQIDPNLLNQLPPQVRDHFIDQQRQTIMQNQMIKQLMKKEEQKKPPAGK